MNRISAECATEDDVMTDDLATSVKSSKFYTALLIRSKLS
jgi:hypothetical protein